MNKKKNKKPRVQAYRTTLYMTLIYPESAPENWRDILAMQFVPAFISPLHCDDKNPDGEPKKPHYHVMVMFSSLKSEEQAQCFFDKFGGVGCKQLSNKRGAARYLCHLDNIEKAPYDPCDVVSLGGVDYFDVINSVDDRHQIIRLMQKYCKDNKITAFAEFADYCAEYNALWHRSLVANPYYIKEYIKSQWLRYNGYARD